MAPQLDLEMQSLISKALQAWNDKKKQRKMIKAPSSIAARNSASRTQDACSQTMCNIISWSGKVLCVFCNFVYNGEKALHNDVRLSKHVSALNSQNGKLVVPQCQGRKESLNTFTITWLSSLWSQLTHLVMASPKASKRNGNFPIA